MLEDIPPLLIGLAILALIASFYLLAVLWPRRGK